MKFFSHLMFSGKLRCPAPTITSIQSNAGCYYYSQSPRNSTVTFTVPKCPAFHISRLSHPPAGFYTRDQLCNGNKRA